MSPSLDFDQEMSVQIPVPTSSIPVSAPVIQVDTSYNPFNERSSSLASSKSSAIKPNENWQDLYKITNELEEKSRNSETQLSQIQLDLDYLDEASDAKPVFQIFGKYIVSMIKSGLIVVDQKRAHERVLFEKYLDSLELSKPQIQPSLFPEDIQLNSSDSGILRGLLKELKALGFDIEAKSLDVFVINGVPSELANVESTTLIERFLEQFKHSSNEKDLGQNERVSLSLARSNAIPYGRSLVRQEMEELLGKLFACSLPYYTATGKPTLFNLTREELEQKFNF